MFPLIPRISFQRAVCTLPAAPGEPQAEREAPGRAAWERERAGGCAGAGGSTEGEDTGGDALPNERCWLQVVSRRFGSMQSIPATRALKKTDF